MSIEAETVFMQYGHILWVYYNKKKIWREKDWFGCKVSFYDELPFIYCRENAHDTQKISTVWWNIRVWMKNQNIMTMKKYIFFV